VLRWITRDEFKHERRGEFRIDEEERKCLEVMYPTDASNHFRPDDHRAKAKKYFMDEALGNFDFCGCDRIACRGNVEKSQHYCLLCGRR